MGSAISIICNGQPSEAAAGETLGQFMASRRLNPRYVAVERNGALVPREQHGEVVLAAEDRLEIVTLVGGG